MLAWTSRNLLTLGCVPHALVLLICCSTPLKADESLSRVRLQDGFAPQHIQELTAKLKIITGWSDFAFAADGRMVVGKSSVGGSKSARDLLTRAVLANEVVFVEDATGRADVVFCNVVQSSFLKEGDGAVPISSHVLRIDFADFSQLMGDAPAREAFNAAWGLLHELDHVINDSPDTLLAGEAGPCEDNINTMRRELALPERAEYFFTKFPVNGPVDFKSRFVRLAFERRIGPKNKKKRYWVLWDAAVVGGLPGHKQIASAR